MINDAHCHFFSSRFLELLAPDGGGADAIAQRLQWEAPGDTAALADRWIAELDRHGNSRAALIASIPGDGGSVAEAVARHPRRFAGFFMHNPAAAGADAILTRALTEWRLRTVCLFPAMHGYHFHDQRVADVFDLAASRRGGTTDQGAAFAHCGSRIFQSSRRCQGSNPLWRSYQHYKALLPFVSYELRGKC